MAKKPPRLVPDEVVNAHLAVSCLTIACHYILRVDSAARGETVQMIERALDSAVALRDRLKGKALPKRD